MTNGTATDLNIPNNETPMPEAWGLFDRKAYAVTAAPAFSG